MTILVPIASASDRHQYGGKSANLAFLAGLGLPVPDAAVVPASEMNQQLALRPELVAELEALVGTLGGRVSVRSSATLEDARTHSFAGQFVTVLDVSADGVAAAVRDVWASTFSENVQAYLRRAELDASKLRMAVVIQRQIPSESAGVVMGRRGGIVVEAVFGQGEALVSGAVAPDRWELEDGRIARRTIAGARPSLTDAQLLELAAAYATITAARGGLAQDCEFAFAGGRLHLLQTRDVTAALPVTAPPLTAFTPPGKGTWELDGSHFQHPCTPMFQALFPPAMTRGFQKTTARYGVLLSHIDMAFANGFAYTRLRPAGAPEDAASKKPPPRWLFKLLLKVVPTLRRRVKAAERVWATREWRTELDEWRVAKERSIATHLQLQDVAVDSLDDAALATHFEAVRDHVSRMIEQHHTFNLAALLPIGDLLVHLARWSDGQVAAGDVCALVTGASPMSADLRSDEARALGAELAAHPEAKQLLEPATLSDARAEAALATLRAIPGGLGDRVRRFLAQREYRLVEGLDPGAPCLRECPSLLWSALRTIAAPAPERESSDGGALERVRAAVAAEHHAELDALIAEARLVAPLRDERALFSDTWAWGILRTTVLAIGRRLRLPDPADLVHATPDEVLSLLRGAGGPSAGELETRAAYRRAYTTRDAPKVIGAPPAAPPATDLLPAGVARSMTAVMKALSHLGSAPRTQEAGAGLRGNAASSGVWEGPAHVVGSALDAREIPSGAVLVVGAGSSVFTMLAPLASAVVAEGGGLLSHVAIVCREYNIPCVCGVTGVLDTLKTGQQVRVDGTRGVVEVVSLGA